MVTRLHLGITTLLLSLSACAASNDGADISKYDQTWTTSYSSTTCGQWLGEMTEQQRWAAAADMLLGARSKDGDADLPPDDLVTAFGSGIANVCEVESSVSITDVAVELYLAERSRFAP